MNATVLRAGMEGAFLASYGSGDDEGRAARRERTEGGRRTAPTGATRNLLARARRAAAAPGRGRRERQRVLQEIEDNARRRRGGARLSNEVLRSFSDDLRELGY
jgi:hypothetical protein